MSMIHQLNPELDVHIGEKWADGRLIDFEVSYSFNGGPEIKRPKLVVPAGYKVVDISIGLMLWLPVPRATKLLVKEVT